MALFELTIVVELFHQISIQIQERRRKRREKNNMVSRGGNSCSRGGFVSGWLVYFDYLGQPEHDSFINRDRICQP